MPIPIAVAPGLYPPAGMSPPQVHHGVGGGDRLPSRRSGSSHRGRHVDGGGSTGRGEGGVGSGTAAFAGGCARGTPTLLQSGGVGFRLPLIVEDALRGGTDFAWDRATATGPGRGRGPPVGSARVGRVRNSVLRNLCERERCAYHGCARARGVARSSRGAPPIVAIRGNGEAKAYVSRPTLSSVTRHYQVVDMCWGDLAAKQVANSDLPARLADLDGRHRAIGAKVVKYVLPVRSGTYWTRRAGGPRAKATSS